MKRNYKDIQEKKTRAAQKANDATRRDWGGVKPVMRVEPAKDRRTERSKDRMNYED